MSHDRSATMITDRWLDRSGWGSGPWDDEPDRADWVDDTTGLPCLALRHEMFATWRGYVAVPPRHPWHGLSYDAVPAEVHRGLTFAGPSDEEPSREHIGLLGESDRAWWFGFDCAHAGDLVPGWPWRLAIGTVYRTLDYVRVQCELLALQAQLAALDETAAD